MATSITFTAAKGGLDFRLFFPGLLAVPVANTLLSGSGEGDWTEGTFTFDYKGHRYRLTFEGANFDFNAGEDFHGIARTGTLGILTDPDEGEYKTIGSVSFLPDRGSQLSGGILDTAAHLTPNALNLMNSRSNGAYLNFLGNNGADKLFGSDFDDYFDGGKGHDQLTGNGGEDQFLFGTIGKADADHVTDFEIDKDTLLIDRGNGLFDGVTSANLRKTFHDITKAAEQSDDRILYNHKTGELSYDPDGSGHKAAVLFGYVDHHPALEWRDFDVA